MASLKGAKDIHKRMVKELLTIVEYLGIKYDIHPNDYNNLRKKFKSWNWKIHNYWVRLFAERIDEKYIKHENIKGEDEEIHVKARDVA